MAIIFPGEAVAPAKPDLETLESFDNSQVGGIEKFGTIGGTDAISGGFSFGRTVTAGSISTTGEVIIGVTDTSSARTIDLSTASTDSGRIFIIKDESGAANVNNITVTTEGAETIDGAASKVINTAYGVLRVYSDGTNFFTW